MEQLGNPAVEAAPSARGRCPGSLRAGGATLQGLHRELNCLGDPGVVAAGKWWRNLGPRLREQIGELGVMAEGAGACREGAELGAGNWVLVVPLGSGKVWFHPRTTGRHELCPRSGARTLGLRGWRKVGASHAGARVYPDPPGATPAEPQPSFGRSSPNPHARLSGRFSRGGSGESGYCLLYGGLFLVLLAREESVC